MSVSYGQTSSTIWGPKHISGSPTKSKTEDVMEISVHTLPKQLLREFQHVFSEEPNHIEEIADPAAEILCLPTNQKARCDLVAVGEDVELEKDRLLNSFIAFAQTLCEKLRSAGYWADFIDPCSGLPMMTRCHKVYSEVDGMECCLNYKSYNAGFCKVLQHPKWGTAVYPATIFARAPRHWVTQLLQEHVL